MVAMSLWNRKSGGNQMKPTMLTVDEMCKQLRKIKKNATYTIIQLLSKIENQSIPLNPRWHQAEVVTSDSLVLATITQAKLKKGKLYFSCSIKTMNRKKDISEKHVCCDLYTLRSIIEELEKIK